MPASTSTDAYGMMVVLSVGPLRLEPMSSVGLKGGENEGEGEGEATGRVKVRADAKARVACLCAF